MPVNLSICKSVILSVCISHISQTFHTIAFALARYVARVPGMCTVLCEVVSMRASYTFNEFLCCAFANIYVLPSAICRVRIGRQMAHLGPWRTIYYNYRGKSLCVRLRGRRSFCTQMSAHTPTDHTLNRHMHRTRIRTHNWVAVM